MGATFSTVFEAKVPPYRTLGRDNREVLRYLERLDRIALENELVPLRTFESYAPDDTAEVLEDDDTVELPPREWFSPADGLAAIDALYAYLEAHPASFATPSKLLEELAGIGEELEAAQKAGVRFRFAVVM